MPDHSPPDDHIDRTVRTGQLTAMQFLLLAQAWSAAGVMPDWDCAMIAWLPGAMV